MKQKSDQDKQEKVTEKVKEKVKREKNMSSVSKEKYQSINPRAYRPKIIQREEGQEAVLAHYKDNMVILPIPKTPPKSQDVH